MPSYARVVLGLAVCAACVPTAVAQEPPAKPKAKVELRWLESKRIEGLTEDKGFQCSCDPKAIVYPHKKPALVLTATEVSEVSLTEHDFTKNNLGMHYTVSLQLTKAARDKLSEACAREGEHLLTVAVDGTYWGASRYVKGKGDRGVPDQARTENFNPTVGIWSKAEAQRLVDAFK